MFLFLRDSLESATGTPEFIGYLFSFLFGAAIGSFLNVVIHRVPNEESIIFPNSACPNCKTSIKPYDNIPILSWLILRGRCRNCHEPISFRYPAVELLTAFLFVFVFWQIGFNPYLPVAFIFVAAIIALIFIDAEHMILPNVITYPLLALAIATRIVLPLAFGKTYQLDVALWPFPLPDLPLWVLMLMGGWLGAVIGGGFLWLVGALWKALRGVDAMGLGDVKMMAAVGALLGWPLTMLAVFLGAFSGAFIGGAMVMMQKDKDLQTQIPFGIFLGTGTIISMLFGSNLIAWYIATFIP
jgi:leader peptidase (prepilin peptidase)/N-methyltransferase